MSLNFMKQFDNLKIDDFMNSSYIIILDLLLAPGPLHDPEGGCLGLHSLSSHRRPLTIPDSSCGLTRQCLKSYGEGRTSTFHSFGYLRVGVCYDDDAVSGFGYSLAKPLRLLRHYDHDHHYMYSTLGL